MPAWPALKPRQSPPRLKSRPEAAPAASLRKLRDQFDHFGLWPRPHRAGANVALRAGHHGKLRDFVAVRRFENAQNVEFARGEKNLLDLDPNFLAASLAA